MAPGGQPALRSQLRLHTLGACLSCPRFWRNCRREKLGRAVRQRRAPPVNTILCRTAEGCRRQTCSFQHHSSHFLAYLRSVSMGQRAFVSEWHLGETTRDPRTPSCPCNRPRCRPRSHSTGQMAFNVQTQQRSGLLKAAPLHLQHAPVAASILISEGEEPCLLPSSLSSFESLLHVLRLCKPSGEVSVQRRH